MAVTANQATPMRNPRSRVSVPVAAGIRIYEGTMVFGIAASGYGTDAIAAGANHFLGIAAAEADNSAGAAGDISVDLYTEDEADLPGTGLTQALVGDKIYASDNYTVTATATSMTLIGRCTEFLSSTKIRVKLEVGAQA